MLAHPSADADALRTALIRGAFEYQGQKCSAASRAYVPALALGRAACADRLAATAESLTLRRRHRLRQLHGRGDRRPGVRPAHRPRSTGSSTRRRAARSSPAARPTTPRATSSGRRCSSATDPTHEIFTTEYFGPILGVHVYDDADFDGRGRARPESVVAVRADRRRSSPRTAAVVAWAARRAALRRRQLLRQRQADRRGRRAAAVRRRPGLRHQRQGRLAGTT